MPALPPVASGTVLGEPSWRESTQRDTGSPVFGTNDASIRSKRISPSSQGPSFARIAPIWVIVREFWAMAGPNFLVSDSPRQKPEASSRASWFPNRKPCAFQSLFQFTAIHFPTPQILRGRVESSTGLEKGCRLVRCMTFRGQSRFDSSSPLFSKSAQVSTASLANSDPEPGVAC